ncbi:MAG: HAD family hydrolase [Lachnospiraceae bacterium]|nr:HAD family hydrolase [Lachnospiraceae bacterium]
MGSQKLLFFDIDNTIWDYDNFIPESTVRTIRAVRENGHKAFLCSGRGRGYIRSPELFDIGFDGVVSGCGTLIEIDGEILLYKKMTDEESLRTVETVRKYGMRPILEGKEYLYMDSEEFGDDWYMKKLTREMGQRLKSISDNWGKWEISKVSCDSGEDRREECFKELEDIFDFIVHTSNVVEMVPKGFSKGTGILKVCELLGAEVSDTFAFGDGENDIEMIKTAGTGIAMGNGNAHARAEADFVTRDIYHDGIYHACKYFELL